jgi:Flp pilus assembly protein CpaB
MATNGKSTTVEVPDTRTVTLGPIPERGIRSRLAFGHVVMIVAGLMTFVLVASVLRTRDATVKVAVAARDVPVGSTVTPDAIRYVELPARSSLAAHLVRTGSAIAGSVALRYVAAGEPLTPGDLRPAGATSQLRTMSIPIGPEHAAGGTLAVGDRVDVVAVDGTRADYVLQSAEIVGVAKQSQSSGLGIGGGTNQYFVSVALDDAAALRVAVALRAGKIEIVRSTGAAPAATPAYDSGSSASSPGS